MLRETPVPILAPDQRAMITLIRTAFIRIVACTYRIRTRPHLTCGAFPTTRLGISLLDIYDASCTQVS